jgi:argininosuccinate lyase
MEYMIARNVPQRTAHHLVGQLVATAMERGVSLSELPVEVYRRAHDSLDESVFEVLGAERAVKMFRSYGSTAPHEVQTQIAKWKERLGMSL